MQILNLVIGPNALQCAEKLDSERISIANKRAQKKTKEARELQREAQKDTEDIAKAAKNLMYGPGIAY
ncbi:hypothetical protein PV327_010111 [Microctonus hyperodae]|uniref:Uncharacterized protein n=1 Tax=Microctonus hyperodae TaxID=165561 RepID=A0AA39KUM5_MICHY|nr:hypothetical protein PV327_010111 [Microctonus hyperodae]